MLSVGVLCAGLSFTFKASKLVKQAKLIMSQANKGDRKQYHLFMCTPGDLLLLSSYEDDHSDILFLSESRVHCARREDDRANTNLQVTGPTASDA